MSRAAKILGEFLSWIVITLMIVLTVVVVVAVIYRKLGASLSWYDEVASILLAWVTYFGAALAAQPHTARISPAGLRRSHIGFDGVLIVLPMPFRLYVAYAAEVLVIAFFVLMAWAGWTVLQVLEGETLVSLTWVPVQLTQAIIPIGAVLFIIAEILSIPDYMRDVRAGVSSEHSTMEDLVEDQLAKDREAEERR